jgi:hypothetical protein
VSRTVALSARASDRPSCAEDLRRHAARSTHQNGHHLAGGNESVWQRRVYVFGAVEAVVFTVIGWLFGREAGQSAVESARSEAESARGEAEKARMAASEQGMTPAGS